MIHTFLQLKELNKFGFHGGYFAIKNDKILQFLGVGRGKLFFNNVYNQNQFSNVVRLHDVHNDSTITESSEYLPYTNIIWFQYLIELTILAVMVLFYIF